ncbi:MAG: hypothetical protein COS92_09385 [Desulfobacterales bacterium CG07_land_8_20_14_0_80_52_14]|nr:MAG: hypothetical protein COX20_10690 [Desulfobacterales bacterium CG23_combo_of_CG06-09_8_20_14_all_52_9]PIU48929.1 MAG: hypothetical protein COS92_09385 [Desulfobacterales bacterium CG07_land_8_20_14_0_80_52_14]
MIGKIDIGSGSVIMTSEIFVVEAFLPSADIEAIYIYSVRKPGKQCIFILINNRAQESGGPR